jgi:cytoskeletal protein CcmA (bactofilin family)
MAKYNLGINLTTINNNKLIVESANGVSINSGLEVTGDVTLNKALNVLGISSFKNLLVDGTLTVNDVTTLKKTLNVTGATTLASTLGVTGNATLGGTLTVTGNTTLNGAANTAKALTTTGVLTGNSLVSNTTSTLKGNTTIGGTLGITGATTVSTLTSTGLTTANSLKVTTTSTLTGAVTASNALTVAGVTTLNGNTNAKAVTTTGLTVNGNETVTGTLTVGGVTTLNGETKTKNLSVTGNETISGALAVTGTGTIKTPDTTAVGTEIVTAKWVTDKLAKTSRVYVSTSSFNSFKEMIDHINTLNAKVVEIAWTGKVYTDWGSTTGNFNNKNVDQLYIRHCSTTAYTLPTFNSDGTIATASTSPINTLVVSCDIDIVFFSDYYYNGDNYSNMSRDNVVFPLNITISGNSNVYITLQYAASWAGNILPGNWVNYYNMSSGTVYFKHIPMYRSKYSIARIYSLNRSLGHYGARVSFEKNHNYNPGRFYIMGGTLNLYVPGCHNFSGIIFGYPTTINVYYGAMAFVPNKTNVTFNQAVNTWSTNGIIYDGTLTNP